MQKPYTIGIVVPTWNSKNRLKRCLTPFLQSPLNPKILVIDSSSTDGTLDIAKELKCETLTIPQKEFNHGLTREKARKHLNTDIVVMLTDDAYALQSSTLETLITPIILKQASIAYARQLPRQGSDFFEAFPREFNYPSTSHIRDLRDLNKWGIYTFFCSNSCAAYLNSALDEIGGFSDVLFGEDTVATAKLLRRGHKIAYVAEAEVKHSHSYTLRQEFQRYFDIGTARNSYKKLLACNNDDSKRGASLVKEMLKRLIKEKPSLLPYALLNISAKGFGYYLGRFSKYMPLFIKKALSSQKYYWKK